MNNKEQVQKLREELAEVRKASLAATSRNDARTVARLTVQAAGINRAISDLLDKAEPGLVASDRNAVHAAQRNHAGDYFSAATAVYY